MSDLLHADNPYAPPVDVPAEHGALADIERRLSGLLARHVMLLAGADHLLMGQISDNEVAVITMHRAPE